MKNTWSDKTIYFITASTFLHYPYFKTDSQKQLVLNQINRLKDRFYCSVSAFSIAINHYHLKIYLENGSDLPKIKQFLNGGISFQYKKKYSIKYKEFWQSCRVFKIESEELDQKVSGYIAGNLLKHREASTFQDLLNNPFSSYGLMVEKYSEDFLQEIIYEAIDMEENDEGIIALRDFTKTG